MNTALPTPRIMHSIRAERPSMRKSRDRLSAGIQGVLNAHGRGADSSAPNSSVSPHSGIRVHKKRSTSGMGAIFFPEALGVMGSSKGGRDGTPGSGQKGDGS